MGVGTYTLRDQPPVPEVSVEVLRECRRGREKRKTWDEPDGDHQRDRESRRGEEGAASAEREPRGGEIERVRGAPDQERGPGPDGQVAQSGERGDRDRGGQAERDEERSMVHEALRASPIR